MDKRKKALLCQWRSQPKNLEGAKKFWGAKVLDFRRITLFCLEKRLSKHKMTVFSKHLGCWGVMAPFAPPGYACVLWSATFFAMGRCSHIDTKFRMQQDWALTFQRVFRKFAVQASTRKIKNQNCGVSFFSPGTCLCWLQFLWSSELSSITYIVSLHKKCPASHSS